jgi:hypothetical protein
MCIGLYDLVPQVSLHKGHEGRTKEKSGVHVVRLDTRLALEVGILPIKMTSDRVVDLLYLYAPGEACPAKILVWFAVGIESKVNRSHVHAMKRS